MPRPSLATARTRSKRCRQCGKRWTGRTLTCKGCLTTNRVKYVQRQCSSPVRSATSKTHLHGVTSETWDRPYCTPMKGLSLTYRPGYEPRLTTDLARATCVFCQRKWARNHATIEALVLELLP